MVINILMVISRRGLAHVNASLQLLGICYELMAKGSVDTGWVGGEPQWDDITQSARVG